MKPAEMTIGTVICASPLKIQTDISRLPIPEVALILTDTVREREEEVYNLQKPPEMIGKIYHKALAVGDIVLMLRVSKGNRYIVLSRIGG